MVVNFMGLIGALGVLPRHYTHLALQEVRRRNTTLRDFLDIFNHRVVSLFYRAWEKHQLPAQYEGMVVRRADGTPDEGSFDRTTLHLFELIGLSSALLRRHVELRSPALLFFVGLIAQQPRSGAALRGVLQEYFAVPVHVLQFRGQWLPLALEDRTSIGRRGVNAVLGDSAIIGEKVWDQQARFRLRLGPLGYAQFCGFLPSGSAFRSLVLLTRLLVGQEYDFDVQLVLLAADVPDCRIGVGGERAPRLGWSAFLKVTPFERDSEAVILGGRETMVGTFAGRE
jgi:type VI secretion system protein ImpH